MKYGIICFTKEMVENENVGALLNDLEIAIGLIYDSVVKEHIDKKHVSLKHIDEINTIRELYKTIVNFNTEYNKKFEKKYTKLELIDMLVQEIKKDNI